MISTTSRFRILAKCNFRCAYCGAPSSDARLEIDHVVPRAKGGTDDESNLTAACFTCNRGKRDHLIEDIVVGNTHKKRKKPTFKPHVKKAPGFLQWLRKQTWRDDPVGDLARDIRLENDVPQTCKRLVISRYLAFRGRHVLHALYTAWREYCGSKLTRDAMRKLRLTLHEGYGFNYTNRGFTMKVDK